MNGNQPTHSPWCYYFNLLLFLSHIERRRRQKNKTKNVHTKRIESLTLLFYCLAAKRSQSLFVPFFLLFLLLLLFFFCFVCFFSLREKKVRVNINLPKEKPLGLANIIRVRCRFHLFIFPSWVRSGFPNTTVSKISWLDRFSPKIFYFN